MCVDQMAHSGPVYVNQNPSDPTHINLWNQVSIQLHQGGHTVTASFYGFGVCLAFHSTVTQQHCHNAQMFTI